jgi:hypothetical protein
MLLGECRRAKFGVAAGSGWGVSDGIRRFETCISACPAGDVYVAEITPSRVDEFAVGKPGPPPPLNPLSAPANIARPTIRGTTKAGQRLTCSTGSWSNPPTSFRYQWLRNGTALVGATSNTYGLGILDEGTALTCLVTASTAAGSGSALSRAVKIPIPYVPRCPGATGRMTGTTIGQIRLGMTRARADYLYRRHSDRGKQYEGFFCLTPIGVRVGYATPKLFRILSKDEQRS